MPGETRGQKLPGKSGLRKKEQTQPPQRLGFFVFQGVRGVAGVEGGEIKEQSSDIESRICLDPSIHFL
jgi:hypothetical protein